jgi:hypothetical protein
VPALAEKLSTEVKVIARGKGFCFAAWREAYILDWRDTPSIEGLDASVLGKREVYAKNPNGVVVLNLLAAETALPSPEVRTYAERKQGEDTSGVLCHGTVLDGRGFWAGTMRSMMAGLYLVSRSPFPRKVFSSVAEAAAWQASVVKLGRDWADGLVEAVISVQQL